MQAQFKTLIVLALAAAVLIPVSSQAQITVDNPGVKNLSFEGEFVFLSDAPVEKIKGTAGGVTGTITTDTTDLSKTTGIISLPVGDMKTGNKTRDKHLRGKHWLQAKKYPVITFEIKSVTVVSVDDSTDVKVAELQATGPFSLHGVTTNLTIPLSLKWKGDIAKVTADFDIALADYKVAGKKGVVGDRVGKTIQISAHLLGKVL